MSYKPEGYASVSPYLIVEDATRTIDFLVRAFGANQIRRFADPVARSGVTRLDVARVDHGRRRGVNYFAGLVSEMEMSVMPVDWQTSITRVNRSRGAVGSTSRSKPAL